METKTQISRAGIIGGLGPRTSSKFCLGLNTKFRKIANRQPNLVMENLPIPLEAEEDLIRGNPTAIHRGLLRDAIIRLNRASVDIIAIPCNTVHCFLGELRGLSKAPILSIIEECAKVCLKQKFRKVGLLATSKTIQDKLFEEEFKNKGVGLLVPDPKSQIMLSGIILNILDNTATETDKKEIIGLISELHMKGAEAVILGCTDLSLIISSHESPLLLLETDSILEDALIRKLAHHHMEGVV